MENQKKTEDIFMLCLRNAVLPFVCDVGGRKGLLVAAQPRLDGAFSTPVSHNEANFSDSNMERSHI